MSVPPFIAAPVRGAQAPLTWGAPPRISAPVPRAPGPPPRRPVCAPAEEVPPRPVEDDPQTAALADGEVVARAGVLDDDLLDPLRRQSPQLTVQVLDDVGVDLDASLGEANLTRLR